MVDKENVHFFKTFLKPEQVLENDTDIYSADRTKHLISYTPLVLKPRTTAELSSILKYCFEQNLLVIPSGGRTGLSGAGVAVNNEIILSLELMNSISEIDYSGATIMVESGVILEHLQNYVEKHGFYFPLDFAAKGSCQIGGCISTNAGGVKVIKYGMTRDLVLGLEVVLADGSILDLNKRLIKDNSGYNLKQLFIGAEGTLGVITKATFKLVSQASFPKIVYLAIDQFNLSMDIFKIVKQFNFDILAFECLNLYSYESVLKAMPQIRPLFNNLYKYYVLLEVDCKDLDKLEQLITTLADSNFISDATIAQSAQVSKEFWLIREAVSDCIYLNGNVHANDISVPISSLTDFLNDLELLISSDYSDFKNGTFGHIGDGNLHIYFVDELNKFNETDFKELDSKMFFLVKKYNGSISAEHGIGLLKKDALHFRRTDAEIGYMRSLKKVFDPKNILNPGKIF